jgi:hypothetical protein
MDKDRAARRHNQSRLRALVRDHDREVDVFCSHEMREFESAAARERLPAAPFAAVPGGGIAG